VTSDAAGEHLTTTTGIELTLDNDDDHSVTYSDGGNGDASQDTPSSLYS
jgi:hypothetical protein